MDYFILQLAACFIDSGEMNAMCYTILLHSN